VRKLEGIDFVLKGKRTKSGKAGRRKPTEAELVSLSAACERAQTASDRIRSNAGLPLVAPNFYRLALAEKLGAAK
jgi:hypothetical protein